MFKNLILIDTETTGVDPENDRVIEFAAGISTGDLEFKPIQEFIYPGSDVSASVSAFTHISNRMLAGAPNFASAAEFILDTMKFDHDAFYVAHNADFDRRMLETEFKRLGVPEEIMGFLKKDRWICTQRLAKRWLKVDPENETKLGYGLQYLRYFLELPVPDDLPPHRADSDVIVLGELVRYLIEFGIENNLVDPDRLFESLVNESWDLLPVTEFPFGKHKGKKLSDIPGDYFMWALENMDALKEGGPNFNTDLFRSIELEIERRSGI